jgi:hypothetical protein
MHAINAIRNLPIDEQMKLPVSVVMAAQKDATDVAYLTGMARTTMGATSDDRTRRETRVKLDALATANTLTATMPDYAPVR